MVIMKFGYSETCYNFQTDSYLKKNRDLAPPPFEVLSVNTLCQGRAVHYSEIYISHCESAFFIL
jgi:hypothetical protein